MQEYKIKRGSQAWTPKKFQVFGRFNELTWVTRPNWTMMFNYEWRDTLGQVHVDPDWADWKKVGGISLVNWRNPQNIFVKNNDAIMLAWRWNVDLQMFEYALYVNRKGENIPYEGPAQVVRVKAREETLSNGDKIPAGFDKVIFTIRRERQNRYRIFIYAENENPKNRGSIIVNTRQRFGTYSIINPWYGGANNAPGPWGGKAPRDMEMVVDFLKK